MTFPPRRLPRSAAALAPSICVIALGLGLDRASAAEPEVDAMAAAAESFAAGDAAVRADDATPPSLAARPPAGEVQWQGRLEGWRWTARVALGAAAPGTPGPALLADTQGVYGGWAGRAPRLGAQARRDLLSPDHTGSALGIWLHDEAALAAGWRVALGLRSDGAPAAHTTLTPRAALSWQPAPDWQLRLVDGAQWRDALGAVAPDTAASPLRLSAGERLLATELAVRWQALGALRLAASLHHQRVGDSVGAVAAGAVPASLQFQALGPAAPGQGIGLEGEIGNGDASWRLRLRWAAFQADVAAEAAAPARVLAALQASTPLPWAGATLALDLQHLDARERVDVVSGSVAQTLLNASLGWAPTGTPWRLAASAYNLADHAAGDAALAPQDTLVREGRRWQLQLGRTF